MTLWRQFRQDHLAEAGASAILLPGQETKLWPKLLRKRIWQLGFGDA
jgi:hypothetical protein